MRLVLINDNKEIVKIYEEDTTQEEIEKEFDNWVRLQELEAKFLSRPKNNVIQISAGSLEAVFQNQYQIFHNELERKIRLEKSFRKMVSDKASSRWNNVKSAFISGLRKVLKKLQDKLS